MSENDRQMDAPTQQEQHIRKLITAIKDSRLAEAWWEFKVAGSTTERTTIRPIATNLTERDE